MLNLVVFSQRTVPGLVACYFLVIWLLQITQEQWVIVLSSKHFDICFILQIRTLERCLLKMLTSANLSRPTFLTTTVLSVRIFCVFNCCLLPKIDEPLCCMLTRFRSIMFSVKDWLLLFFAHQRFVSCEQFWTHQILQPMDCSVLVNYSDLIPVISNASSLRIFNSANFSGSSCCQRLPVFSLDENIIKILPLAVSSILIFANNSGFMNHLVV